MATMVISDAKNMTIAPRKVASQNIREQINNKTKTLLQVEFSQGLSRVESPRSTTSIQELTDTMQTICCTQLLVNVKILNIFCMISLDFTMGGSSDLLQNRTHQLTRNMICFYSFHFIMQGKLKILRTRCFLHQNKSQLQWFKEKTFLQSKFCCKLKSSISKQ